MECLHTVSSYIGFQLIISTWKNVFVIQAAVFKEIHMCMMHRPSCKIMKRILADESFNTFSFCNFSYSTRKTKQSLDFFLIQVGPSCSHLSVNLINHNSHWHQSSSDVPLPQRLIHQTRHEDSFPAEQRMGLKQAPCNPLPIDPSASFSCCFLYLAGKNYIEHFVLTKWREGSLITFPQGSLKFYLSSHLSLFYKSGQNVVLSVWLTAVCTCGRGAVSLQHLSETCTISTK